MLGFIGTLLAGLFGGLITGISIIIGNDTKAAEYRNARVEAQRKDIGIAIAAAVRASHEADVAKRADHLAIFEEAFAHIATFQENGKVQKWNEVVDSLGDLRNAMLLGASGRGAFENSRKKIVEKSQVIIAEQWDMVTSGGAFFSIFKHMIIGYIIALMGVALTFAFVFNFYSMSDIFPHAAPAPAQKALPAPSHALSVPHNAGRLPVQSSNSVTP